MRNWVVALLTAVLLAGPMTATSAFAVPTLVVNGASKLTGARGVEVGGALYDVSFQDGSCISLYAGCDPATFSFTTLAGATAASEALRDQVLLNFSSWWTLQYDSFPQLTEGCGWQLPGFASVCLTLTPYGMGRQFIGGPLVVWTSMELNQEGARSPSYIFQGFKDVTYDTAYTVNETYAIWSPVTVDAPSTLACAALGSLCLAIFSRRRSHRPA